MLRTILSEGLDRFSRRLTLREECTQAEYQYWLNRNPIYLQHDSIDRVELVKRLNMGGTNDVFLARNWIERLNGEARTTPRDIVVKICKYWAPRGPSRHHRLNMILAAFQDEIRINNLVRATNIEGVVQSYGGGIAGRYPYLKLEYIPGVSLDKTFRTDIDETELIVRMAKLAYLANTISQLHYYEVVHKDLKPKNLLLCYDDGHPNNHKILVCDFGFAQAKIRESVTEYGGQISPGYSAPEQAVQGGDTLGAMVDYFSFGVIMHEFLTGYNLFPDSMRIFVEDNYRITDRYLQHIRTGRVNRFTHPRWGAEIAGWIDALTTYDSHERRQKTPNLFHVAHRLRELVNATGYRDINTDFLWNQLKEYGKV